MILVNINHYLNQQGLAHFPSWFDTLFKTIKSVDGFINIGYRVDKELSVARIILLFETDDELNQWSVSSKKMDIVNQLDPYRTKPWDATRQALFSQDIKGNTTDKIVELIGFNLCPFTQRIAIILNEKNIKYSVTYIDLLCTGQK
jgi:antibiotic biosynthesis monooxygenase (ABM) superfamily enzyme